MDSTTNKITNHIKAHIGHYNAYSARTRDRQDIFGTISLNMLNERTIAHFFDVSLEKELNKSKLNYAFISECSLNQSIPNEIAQKSKKEIAIKPNKALQDYLDTEHNWFIPDTVIIRQDQDKSPAPNPSIWCLEYKIDSKFDCCKLAIDYLKYKFYSSQFNCHSVFIYVLFYKIKTSRQEIEFRNPSIVKLQTSLTSKDLPERQSSIFIYHTSQESQDVNFDTSILTTMKKVDYQLRRLEAAQPPSLQKTATKLYDNIFFQKRNAFGNKVIYAKIICQNYPAIYEISQRIQNGTNIQHSDNTSYQITKNNFINHEVPSKEDIEGLYTHFNNQIAKMLKEEEDRIPAAFQHYRKRSTWVMIIIRQFLINLGWEDLLNATTLDIDQNSAEKYQEMLKERYKNRTATINSLSIGLVHFIINLFPLIFIITNSHEIRGFRPEYEIVEQQKSINASFQQLIKQLELPDMEQFYIDNINCQQKFLQAIIQKFGNIQ